MITFIKGDLTTVTSGLVIHGTNASNGFGSGVALAIKIKWPRVAEVFYNSGCGEKMLGKFIPVIINDELTVGNCYTQLHYGNDGKRYASVEAVNAAISSAFKYAACNDIKTISMPKIASDRGGLSWENEVLPIVQNITNRYSSIDLNIYYID